MGPLQLLPRVLLHPDQRVLLLRRVDPRQLPGGLEPRQLRPAPQELAAHHHPCGRTDALPVLARRLRAGAVLLPLQPHPARDLPRCEPAAPAGPAHPRLPDVPRDPAADVHERERDDAQQLLGADLRQHRLPDGVLRLRAEQLHEDPAPRDLRVRRAGRGERVAPVLAADDAPRPAGPRGPRDAAGDLDLQRVLLGHRPHLARREVPGHERTEQPARAVLRRHQPRRRRVDHRRPTRPRRVLRRCRSSSSPVSPWGRPRDERDAHRPAWRRRLSRPRPGRPGAPRRPALGRRPARRRRADLVLVRDGPAAHNALDDPWDLTVLPTSADGWLGTPGSPSTGPGVRRRRGGWRPSPAGGALCRPGTFGCGRRGRRADVRPRRARSPHRLGGGDLHGHPRASRPWSWGRCARSCHCRPGPTRCSTSPAAGCASGSRSATSSPTARSSAPAAAAAPAPTRRSCSRSASRASGSATARSGRSTWRGAATTSTSSSACPSGPGPTPQSSAVARRSPPGRSGSARARPTRPRTSSRCGPGPAWTG